MPIPTVISIIRADSSDINHSRIDSINSMSRAEEIRHTFYVHYRIGISSDESARINLGFKLGHYTQNSSYMYYLI